MSFIICERAHIKDSEGNALNAGIDDDMAELWLDEEIVLARKRLSVVHEVFHQLFHYADIGREVTEEQAESMIVRLSPWWLDVLRRNPQLIAFLVEP